jgi:NAD(P)-dependent dehydrogenase (short-subunit alcohol dehydrogenase family)
MHVLESFSLKGKVAIVTGGAGKYGKQVTLALAEAGADTFIASRNVEASGKVASEFRSQGLSVRALPLDQGEERSILALRDEVLRLGGRIDVLVNNALSQFRQGWHDDASLFEQSMHVNATGIFMITRAMGDVMAAQGGGSIINIASILGMVGPDPAIYQGIEYALPSADYHFHKGGMITFTKYTAAYYGAKKVRCNCISPGGLQESEKPAGYKTKGDWDAITNRWYRHTLLGRLANDTDLMGIVVLLASDASAYITGVNIPVDGGYLAT